MFKVKTIGLQLFSVNDPEADISVIIRLHAALESSLVGNSPCSGSSLLPVEGVRCTTGREYCSS